MSRLERLTERVTELYDGFRFSPRRSSSTAASGPELCDWYLELAKPRLYEEDNAAVSAVLLWALERIAAAAAPGDAVRDRGDLVADAGRGARAAGGAALAGADRRASTRRPSAELGG